jgi:hypothetical protein
MLILIHVHLLISSFPFAAHLLALECIQCDRQALWYSPEENERHIARCQKGLIPANRCTNATHTHCIYSYYRQGGGQSVRHNSFDYSSRADHWHFLDHLIIILFPTILY